MLLFYCRIKINVFPTLPLSYFWVLKKFHFQCFGQFFWGLFFFVWGSLWMYHYYVLSFDEFCHFRLASWLNFCFPLQTFSSALQVGWIWQHLFQVGFAESETCFNISAKFSSFFFPFWRRRRRRRSWTFVSKFSRWRISHTHFPCVCPNLLNFQRSRENIQFWVLKNLSTFNISRKVAPILKKLRAFVGLAYQGKDIMFRFIIEYRV